MKADVEIPSWNRCSIPPCICRILAKGSDGLLMTDVELMQKTGWGWKRLRSIYRTASWKDVKEGEKDLFLWACGLHPSKQRRYMWLLKRAWKNGMDGIRNMKHLRANASWKSGQITLSLRMVETVLKNEQRGQ